MKDFVKMTLAAILGCIIVGAILMFMTFGIIGSLASLGNTQPVMPREGILTVDMSRITLEVRPSNEPAVSLYESMGFKQDGIRPGFYDSPKEDAAIYSFYF